MNELTVISEDRKTKRNFRANFNNQKCETKRNVTAVDVSH